MAYRRIDEEEHLAFTLKASTEAIWIEQVARVAGFNYDRALEGLLPGEASGAAEVTKETMEVLASILETLSTMVESEALIPVLEVISKRKSIRLLSLGLLILNRRWS